MEENEKLSLNKVGKLGQKVAREKHNQKTSADSERIYNLAPKLCKECGKPLTYRQITCCKARVFCSIKCSVIHSNKHRSEKRNRDYYKNPNKCLQCGKPINFFKRNMAKFCSHACHGKYISKNKGPTTFICIYCGKEYTRHSFRAGKYCGPKCQANHSKEKIYKKVENGESVTSKNIRNYLLSKYSTCMSSDCLWDWSKKSVVLELHHIDGNSSNNVLQNCLLLCPNCHSLTKTYKNKNRGKGRFSRRVRYNKGKSY